MEKTIHLLIMYTMLVLMLLLFHKGRKHPRSLILALYAMVEVITNGLNSITMAAGWRFFDQFPFVHFIYKPLYCLWAPFFYFYFRSCLSPDFRIKRSHWPHFVPSFVFLLFFLGIWITCGNHYIWENLYQKGTFLNQVNSVVDMAVKLQYLVYNYWMIRLLLKKEKERKEHKPALRLALDIRWLRFVVYGYAFGCLTGIASQVFELTGNAVAEIINLVSISYFFLFFFVIFYNAITHKSYEEEIVRAKSQSEPDDDMRALMNQINELMANQQLFLEPELSLQQMAEKLQMKERVISQVINTVEQRNVNDYINSHRIEYACRLLLESREKPVFEVMYESGFSTKGAFNLAFKKIKGITPTQYRDANNQ